MTRDPERVVEARGILTLVGGRVIHRDLDLDVFRGEVLAVIGGSGTGKTVLLRHLIGLSAPRAGRVRVFGHDLSRADGAVWRDLASRWGVVFQGGALFSALTVFENVALPLRELRLLDSATIARLALLKLDMVGLARADAAKLPAELSGGMVKRAALARALSTEPELLVLDEPTAGLDPPSADAFQGLIGALQRELGLTVVMVTHDLATLRALATRVAALADQRLVASGALEEVMASEHPFLREYFSDERARV